MTGEAEIVAVYGSAGIVGWGTTSFSSWKHGIAVGRKGNVGAAYWSDVDFYPIDTTYFVKTELPLAFVFQQLQTLEFIDSHAAVPGLLATRRTGWTLSSPRMASCTSSTRPSGRCTRSGAT